MASKEWAQRIVSALHALGKRTHGGLSRAERDANVAASYIRRRKYAGTIDLAKMMALLEALDEHPGRFFRQVFPLTEIPTDFMEPPNSAPPAVLGQAQARLNSTRPGSIPRSHLTQLDALRTDEPWHVAEGVEAALPHIEHDDVPYALGVWASAQRLLLALDDATHALLTALLWAQDLESRGDLLQRLARVVSDTGNYAHSLEISCIATDTYARAGNVSRVGQTLVDRGERHFYLNEYHAAIALHAEACPLLAETDFTHRATTWQGRALCYQALGQLEEAQKCISAAQTYANQLGTTNRTKLLWLEATIDCSRGELSASEGKLISVVEIFRKIHLGETALASIDLAHVQLIAGKAKDAHASAASILPLLTPLSGRNAIVRAAESYLVELARHGASRMTTESITKLRGIVERLQRERHSWRSLANI